MRTLICFVFKVPSHSYLGCDLIVAHFTVQQESLVGALCYAYLTHFLVLKRLFDFFQAGDNRSQFLLKMNNSRFRLFPHD